MFHLVSGVGILLPISWPQNGDPGPGERVEDTATHKLWKGCMTGLMSTQLPALSDKQTRRNAGDKRT